jgi:hypothetical protein
MIFLPSSAVATAAFLTLSGLIRGRHGRSQSLLLIAAGVLLLATCAMLMIYGRPLAVYSRILADISQMTIHLYGLL